MHEREIETVYHYCSLETFLSIAKNRTIRLSDISKSNDLRETKATIDMIREKAIALNREHGIEEYQPIMMGTNNDVAMTHLIERVLDRLYHYSDVLVYAACFSEERDLLSQWCEYADNGKGIVIGFNLECLRKICLASDDFLKIDKVLYLNQADNLLNSKMDEYAHDFYQEIIGALANEEIEQLLTNPNASNYIPLLTQKQLVIDSVFYKHESFSPEKEWRIVSNQEIAKSQEDWGDFLKWNRGNAYDGMGELFPEGLQFRGAGDHFISYLDLSFENHMDEIMNSIGLGPNCKVKEDDMFIMLQHFGFESIDDESIYTSTSSYSSTKR